MRARGKDAKKAPANVRHISSPEVVEVSAVRAVKVSLSFIVFTLSFLLETETIGICRNQAET